jgi:hypothetical protein
VLPFFFEKQFVCLFCFRNILLPFEKHYIKIVLLPKYFVAVFVFGSARDNSRGTPFSGRGSPQELEGPFLQVKLGEHTQNQTGAKPKKIMPT